ncbi:hypothetical protein, partial [Maribacter sp. 2-571]|uniref:hypothetical protein n=1 Tax=Maribacter sp. 2-571 TaxID=3417569 RepID=UPI003D34504E
MKNILVFLNELRLNKGAAWVDENNILKFSIPKKFQNDDTKSLIQKNKLKLISILISNNIFSVNAFFSKKEEILNVNSNNNIGPLSFSQQRLWFIESYEGGTNAYHMPMV